MSCTYEFIAGPTPCFIESVNETLGRDFWEHPDYPGQGIVFRTRDENAFNTTLNGAQLFIEMYGTDGVNDILINPIASIFYIALFPVIKYVVRIVENGVETFNTEYLTTSAIVGSPGELVITPTYLPSSIITDVNNALLGVGIVTGAIDDVHTSIVSTPPYLLTATLTIANAEGLSEDIDPPDRYRTGPAGAFVYVGTSQQTGIDTPGATTSVNQLKFFDTNTCGWTDYDPLNP